MANPKTGTTGAPALVEIPLTAANVRRWIGWAYALAVAVVSISLLLLLTRRTVYDGFPIYQAEAVFQLNREASVPTWVSAMLLLMAALAAGLVARDAVIRRAAYRWHWIGLAFILALMSIDEVATMHEQLTEPMRNNFQMDGLLFYAWVVPVGAVLLVLGAVYLPFVLALPARTRWRCIAAAAMAIGGGMVLEMIGGSYHAAEQMGSPVYLVLMASEELLELLAWVTVLWAMLEYRLIEQPERAEARAASAEPAPTTPRPAIRHA